MLVPLSEIRATGRVPGLGRDHIRNLLSMRDLGVNQWKTSSIQV